MRYFLTILCFLLYGFLFCQDTLRIYFDLGKWKMDKLEEKKLRNLHVKYDLSTAEKIQFIGYADSLGNLESNLRLSMKRAQHVFKNTKSIIGDSITTEILAKGEGTKNNPEENRRVDIIFYYPEAVPEPVEDIIHNVDPKCFYVDFQALEYCNIKEITKGKRKYISIEAMVSTIFTEQKHYYVVKGNGGKYTIKRLTWKKKKTGKLWWKKQRLVATLPKESFDKFQFFTLENGPCDGCKENIFSKDTIIMNVPKYYPDHFIMDNMQVSLRFFKYNEVKIRVPKEYVDIQDDYYYSHKAEEVLWLWNAQNKVEWTTKKFGKKRQDFYYANVPIYDNYLPYLHRKKMTTICLGKRHGTDSYSGLRCGTDMDGISGGLQIKGAIEPGIFYHNDSLTAFLAGGIEINKFVNLNLLAGINSRLGFYGTFHFRCPITSFRLKSLNPEKVWVSPKEMQNAGSLFMHLYWGAEGRTSYTKKYQSFFEGNLHLGLKLIPRIFKGYPTIYLQGGAGYDFTHRLNDKIYPYIQTGIRIYLF